MVTSAGPETTGPGSGDFLGELPLNTLGEVVGTEFGLLGEVRLRLTLALPG